MSDNLFAQGKRYIGKYWEEEVVTEMDEELRLMLEDDGELHKLSMGQPSQW